jgi:hypothetical protein
LNIPFAFEFSDPDGEEVGVAGPEEEVEAPEVVGPPFPSLGLPCVHPPAISRPRRITVAFLRSRRCPGIKFLLTT